MSARRSRLTGPALPGAEPPDGGVVEGPTVPASASAVSCEGTGKGTRRDLEAGGPRAPAFRCGGVWRARGVPGLATAACEPSLGPRDPPGVWRVLVAWGPGAKGVVDLFVHAVSSVPGPRRFSNGLFVSSD